MQAKKRPPIKRRNIQFHFCVDEEERRLIQARMEMTGMVSRAAFIRRMVVKGYFVNVDLADINETIRLLRNVYNNLNQLFKRAEEIQSVHVGEIDELRRRYDSLWDVVNQILKGLAKIE